MLRQTLLLALASALTVPTLHATDKPKYQQVSPIVAPNLARNKDAEKWANKMLKKMSLAEKIGQMIQVRGIMDFQNANSAERQKMLDDIHRYHLGSVLMTVNVDGANLTKNDPYESVMDTNQLQQDAHQKVPLIFAADFERGPSMRMLSVPDFPHAMAFGATHDPAYAERFGRAVADESRALGIQWNYFPVADVNTNPANPVINTRSFGEDPAMVAAMTAAYIRGSHAGGMLATSKHFPGHGDTNVDSHLGVPRVDASVERMNQVELVPFKTDIDAGVDAVMVAHIVFPALEPDTNKVSTISAKIVTGLLRGQLGFKNVIVTDAMEMQGLAKLYSPDQGNPSGRAAVDAIKAGNDMVELPSDLDGCYNGLLAAAKSGDIPKSRIDESVRRILMLKYEVGLNKGALIDPERTKTMVGRPDDFTLAQDVADHAITLVRDDAQQIPLIATKGTSAANSAYRQQGMASSGAAANLGAANPLVAILVVSDVHGSEGRVFEKQLRARVPNARVIYVDNRVAPLMADSIMALVPNAQRIITAVYTVPAPGLTANGATVGATTGVLLQRILGAAADKTTVIAMGSPYTILDYPAIKTYLCTFSTVTTSEAAAVKALFGEIPIHGRLPVTLPNVAALDSGIDRDVTSQPVSAGSH